MNTQRKRLIYFVGHTVSSLQIADSWVENMTAVKMAKRRLSKMRNIMRITVAGGEYELHPERVAGNTLAVVKTAESGD